MAAKIKKGDKVIVIAGRDKGRKARSSRCAAMSAARWSAASTW